MEGRWRADWDLGVGARHKTLGAQHLYSKLMSLCDAVTSPKHVRLGRSVLAIIRLVRSTTFLKCLTWRFAFIGTMAFACEHGVRHGSRVH